MRRSCRSGIRSSQSNYRRGICAGSCSGAVTLTRLLENLLLSPGNEIRAAILPVGSGFEVRMSSLELERWAEEGN